MVNMTIALPEEIHKKMKQFSEIKWPEIVRKAFQEKINDLNEMNKILAKSKLTKKDVEIISKTIKSSAARKF